MELKKGTILKDICKNITKIKTSRGIYFLFDKGEIVYVGQSDFIEKRVFEHLSTKLFDSYSFIEYSQEYILSDIEADFILKIKPRYNKSIPTNNLWFSRHILSRIYSIPMLKTRNAIKNNEVEHIEFNNIDYVKWDFKK